jgi:histidinol-phosphatase
MEFPTAGYRSATQADDMLRVATLAADAGARTALSYTDGRDLGQRFKDDGSRVTRADLAVEEIVRRTLTRLTPGVAVLAEEATTDSNTADTSSNDGGSGDRWIVDPIDGTENFSRGNPIWAILIAFESAGVITAAVVSAPALRRCWTAVLGGGAFANGRRIGVSAYTERGASTFSYGGLHECPSEQATKRVLAAAQEFRCAWGWGNFWGHVQVAQGSAEAALSFGVELWDVAAPALLVSEAGGHWTDIHGSADLLSGSLLTSNGHLHCGLVHDLAPQHMSSTSQTATTERDCIEHRAIED